jgi:DHA3 family macrolide efflux protein-like MFS transporter
MKSFLTVWAGQLLSLTGSAITSFALGIWIYQHTKSASLFSILALFTVVPSIVVAPFAGVVADRWNRRAVMILGDATSGIISLLLALLIYTGGLRFWHICIVNLLAATIGSFHRTAYAASVALLVEQKDLTRASGLMQVASASSQLLSPMVAALLVVTVRLTGIVLIDMATFVIGIVTLLRVHVPSLPHGNTGGRRRVNVRRDLLDAWAYLRTQPGLLALNGFSAAINTLLSSAGVLLAPLVLSFGSPAALGGVMTSAGAGALAGALVLAAWGGPKSPAAGAMVLSLFTALCVAMIGLRPSAVLVSVGVFGALATLGAMNGCIQAVMQSLVPNELQGRVLAGAGLMMRIAAPIGYIFAGPIVDKVLEPMLSQSGFSAHIIGAVIGTGPGRGVGLYYVATSILCATTTLVAGPSILRSLGVNSAAEVPSGACSAKDLPTEANHASPGGMV